MKIERIIYADVTDDQIEWFYASDDLGINIACYILAGAGTVTIKRRSKNHTLALLNNDGTNFEMTTSFEDTFDFKRDDRFGVGIADADSALELLLIITGNFTIRHK